MKREENSKYELCTEKKSKRTKRRWEKTKLLIVIMTCSADSTDCSQSTLAVLRHIYHYLYSTLNMCTLYNIQRFPINMEIINFKKSKNDNAHIKKSHYFHDFLRTSCTMYNLQLYRHDNWWKFWMSSFNTPYVIN